MVGLSAAGSFPGTRCIHRRLPLRAHVTHITGRSDRIRSGIRQPADRADSALGAAAVRKAASLQLLPVVTEMAAGLGHGGRGAHGAGARALRARHAALQGLRFALGSPASWRAPLIPRGLERDPACRAAARASARLRGCGRPAAAGTSRYRTRPFRGVRIGRVPRGSGGGVSCPGLPA
jgi:hypothetical protein